MPHEPASFHRAPLCTGPLLISIPLLLSGCLDNGSRSTLSEPVPSVSTAEDDAVLPTAYTNAACLLGEEQLRMLQQVNAARSQGRLCGESPYPAAPPLAWSCLLEQAALGHSLDMGDVNFFSHIGSDGLGPDARVERVGYAWQALAENISAGYESLDATIQGWLGSPAHCGNIMNGNLTEMGLAYHRPTAADFNIYWTQKLARPR